METVKARRQGNSIVVTLASKLTVKEGQEFYYYKDDQGVISLIPKVDDLVFNYIPKGKELDD